MSVEIRHLFFRFEGVLAQTLESALAEGAGALDPDSRRLLRDASGELRSGRLAWDVYWSKIAGLVGSPGDGTALSRRALDRLEITPGIEEVVAALDGRSCWLFCELPPEPLQPTLERLALERLFPRERRYYPRESCRSGRPKGPFARLVTLTRARGEELLWIDDRPAVAALAIRSGLNAVAFVDSKRLRRNLVLRGLLT